MNWSIRTKLPLFVSGLLLAVVFALLTIGYGEVRRASRLVANKRLEGETQVLAGLLQRSPSQQRTQLAGVATDPGVLAFLTSNGQHGRAQALAALHRVVRDTSRTGAVELWDAEGRLRLQAGLLDHDPASLTVPTDSAVTGPLTRRDTLLYYEVVAQARHEGRTVGRVHQFIRVQRSPQSREALTGLAGGDLTLLLGNATGDPWMDMAEFVPAPPEVLRSSPTALRYFRGEMRRGHARPIAGTPWMIAAELPSRIVVAPAQAYLRRMLPIAAVVVLIGALGAWWGSRRITIPLHDITMAAEAIARGDLSRRTSVDRGDELGRLARSFNTMAAQVGRSLQHSETLLRSVTETAHDAIIAADDEGIIRFWNPGAARMFGYAADEVSGKPLTVLMPQRFHEAHRAGIRRYIETREPRVVGKTVELEGRRKDGTEFPIELSLGAAAVEGGMSFTGVIRDITERKRTAEALQATNAELESFSYSVSHDLRAPLRAIHGFARILLEDHHAKLDPEAQRLLGVIDQNTRRMGQLIDDLLAFSRLGRQGIAAAPVDMSELTHAVADEVRRAEGERKGSLDIRIDALLPARGDRALLRQVVSNLLQNAAKFTRGREHARVEVGSHRNGREIVYHVKDNGAGFDPRYADKLFGVFQRLHGAHEFEGTGVGLAIVKRIVQRHGGRVWAEGKLSEGAAVYFALPTEDS